jgi:hypothetical protein
LVGLFGVAVSTALANVGANVPQMNELERWGVFTLGAGFNQGPGPNGGGDQGSGNSYVQGDVGVAGNGNISLSGDATIAGNVYLPDSKHVKKSGNAQVYGSEIDGQDGLLNTDMQNSIDASDYANSETPSPGEPDNIMLSGNQSLTITPRNDHPGNTTVLSLQNFTLSGSSALILTGDGTNGGPADNNYVINVHNNFSLSGNSKIILTGGLAWDDVLFNVIGGSGQHGHGPHQPMSNLEISGNSTFNGILMAIQRTVNVSGNGFVNGEVIADTINVSGGARIIHPPTTSP